MDDRKRITDEALSSSMDDAFHWFRKYGKAYNRGCLLDDEFMERMKRIFFKNFYGLLKDNGLRLCFSTASWLRFMEDFSLWGINKKPDSSLGEPWILDDNLDDHSNNNGWLGVIRASRGYGFAPGAFALESEASVHDKAQFFHLMDNYHVAPEFFEPLPDHIIAPDKHHTHTYHNGCTYVIGYDCVDDGGLLNEDNPTGKTYELKSSLGLKAVVTITEDRREKDRRNAMDYDDYCPLGEYLAEGHIEGYTAVERKYPKVVIRTDGQGKVSHLGICQGWKDDYAAFKRHPLWREYFEWNNAKENRRNKMFSDFFDTFKVPL